MYKNFNHFIFIFVMNRASCDTHDKRVPTFPLVVRKELEVGVVARVWLARRQKVPVVPAGVGVLITADGTRVLEEQRHREIKETNQGQKE